MNIHFYKYHGAGNDFVIIDNREGQIKLSQERVAFLCHRHFGIGADGLMLLEQADGYDFKMVYYNSDGNESSMCGNGGRCITTFAHKMNVIGKETNFVAIDGPHHATIDDEGLVHLAMQDVSGIDTRNEFTVLNTGSPHYVEWVKDLDSMDVYRLGNNIRNSDEFKKEGINVNFVQILEEGIKVRTYERGVENETLSCGTGVTACAIATTQQLTGNFTTPIITPGGQLQVSFTKPSPDSAEKVILTGPAQLVFEGDIML